MSEEKEEEFVSWTDKAVEEISKRKEKEFVCEGMWTPSGYFHIGNARTEIFTPYAVFKALTDKGFKARHNLIVDDFDALKKIPADLGIEESGKDKFIGFPLIIAPSPVKGFDNWAEFFISEVKENIEFFGVKPNIISAFETYKKGKLNDLIIESLNKSKQIAEIWARVSGAEKEQGFLPVVVVCRKCGKTHFTTALEWDGKEVLYYCKNCGLKEKISPLNGNAKLNWRVHWCAFWILNKVSFESAGKDHFSRGGSVDVGHALMKEVFKKIPPHQFPTEFIQVHGAKMAGSVGNTVNFTQWLEVAQPELFRYMNFAHNPNKTIDFDLRDNSFILLNDRFERAERIFFGLEKAENEKIELKLKRAYELSAIKSIPKKLSFHLPFSFAVFLAQLFDPANDLPKAINVLQETNHVFEKLSKEEEKEIQQKLTRAKNWVQKYAPENLKISFSEIIPVEAKNLRKELIESIKEISKGLPGAKTAEDIQSLIYSTAKDKGIPPKELFESIYLLLLGKKAGPKIGSLIMAFGKEKVIRRLNELE